MIGFQNTKVLFLLLSASVSSKLTDLNKSDSLFSKFKPTSGQWECEVCLVRNKADISKCAACQSPKPLKAFKHPPGDWVCDTCLVNNKEKDVKCVACNYARPGPPRTQTGWCYLCLFLICLNV